jgi:hypothetical protein
VPCPATMLEAILGGGVEPDESMGSSTLPRPFSQVRVVRNAQQGNHNSQLFKSRLVHYGWIQLDS